MKDLQDRLRAIIRANMGEQQRTRELLADTERKVEDRIEHMDSIESIWESTARKFRKQPISATADRLPPENGSSDLTRDTARV